jgi:3-hydroxyisobutyrate dehydrogenase-like beta-hydroxyacid dehydrogenase
MARIGFIGMGAMGSRMTVSLLEAGHDVAVWDRFPEAAAPLVAKGARLAASPREAARRAEFVFVMVWDDDASRQVWLDPANGALQGMEPGSIAVECATLTTAWIKELHAACRARGIDSAEAPMSGSLPHAEARTLVFVVGAMPEILERLRPLLLAMGHKVNHAGGPGRGIAAKLMINTMLGVQVAMMSEVVALMRAGGMDAAHIVEMMSTTPVLSPRLHAEAKHMLAGNFDTRVRVSQMVKDLGYALDQARECGVPAPLATAARDLFARAAAQGFTESDMTVLAKLYAEQGQLMVDA